MGSAANRRSLAPSPCQPADAMTQPLTEHRWSLAAPRIQVGAAERATGGKRAHALTAARTNMRSNGSHITSKQHPYLQRIRTI
jgi:hypothetical protein